MRSAFPKAAAFLNAAALLMLCAGCVSDYVPPEPSTSSSLVTFKYGGVPVKPIRYAVLYRSDGCQNPSWISIWKSNKDADELSINFSAGERKLIKLGMDFGSVTCDNLVSFVPERQKHYEITQIWNHRRCRSIVTDAATGEVPASFEVHEMTGSCA